MCLEINRGPAFKNIVGRGITITLQVKCHQSDRSYAEIRSIGKAEVQYWRWDKEVKRAVQSWKCKSSQDQKMKNLIGHVKESRWLRSLIIFKQDQYCQICFQKDPLRSIGKLHCKDKWLKARRWLGSLGNTASDYYNQINTNMLWAGWEIRVKIGTRLSLKPLLLFRWSCQKVVIYSMNTPNSGKEI